MSQAEFDAYLSLMAKFLRLRSRQRDELADELRDHLDSRLDELLAQGKSREEAVSIALEEFGDAAVLAEDFSRLASRHRRRFVMRCTAASAAVVAAVVLLTLSLAPPVPDGPGPQNLVAQEEPKPADPDAGITAPPIPDEASIEQQAVAALDEKLGKLMTLKIDFTELPLTEVLDVVAEEIEADVLIDKSSLEEEGVTYDTPVSLYLTRTPVTARTVLEFVLEPHDLAFVNRSGVIYVTTMTKAEELLTTKVYNVRDLLYGARPMPSDGMPGMMGGYGGEAGMEAMDGSGAGMGGGGFFSVPVTAGTALLPTAASQMGLGGMGGMGGGYGGMAAPPSKPSPSEELIGTIQQTMGAQWFDVSGTGGSLTVFNGLLVVRQTEEVHTEIQKLLDALRQASKQQPGTSVTVPKEGEKPKETAGDDAAAVDRPATREEFIERLKQYGLDENAESAVVSAFMQSGGSRTLCPVTLLAHSVNGDEGPLQDALRSLNVEPDRLNSFINVPDPCPASPYPLLDAADKLAGDGAIGTQHLVLALLKVHSEPTEQALQTVGLTADELEKRLQESRGEAREVFEFIPEGNADDAE